MSSLEQDRWDRVAAELVLGEAVSEEDLAFLEDRRRSDAACAAELAMLDGLAGVVDGAGSPDPEAAAIAQAALARVDAEPLASELPASSEGAATPAAEDSRVSARDRARRPVWIAAAAVALAAAAVVAFVVWPAGTPAANEPAPAIATLTRSSGEVFVDGRPATETNAMLADGATLIVGEDSTACLAIDTAVDVCFAPSTNATLSGLMGDALQVEIEYGRAVARLEPTPRVRSFALSSGDVRATAVGTIFTLRRDGETPRVTTSVLEGVIDVHVGSEAVRLSAPEQATIEGDGVTRERPDASREVDDLALLQQAPSNDGTTPARLVVESTPSGAMVRVDGVDVGPSPVTTSITHGAHVVELVADGRSTIRETIAVEAGDVVRRRFEPGTVVADASSDEPAADGGGRMDGPAPDDAAEPTDPGNPGDDATSAEASLAEPRKPTATAADMIARARLLLRESKWSAAARAYGALRRAHPKSGEAHAALVSLGDLQLDHLGKPRAAARSYEKYLTRGGALSLEARYGRVRAYRAARDAGREAKAIRSFLAKHPRNGRSPALKTRLAELDPP